MALAGALFADFTSPLPVPVKDGGIPIIHFQHIIRSERNAATGQIIGDRHGLLTFRKRLDGATPIFHAMLALEGPRNKFSKFELFLRELSVVTASTGPNSKPERYYQKIALTGAEVVSIETTMPDYADPDTRNVHEYEDIKVAYEAISWTSLAKSGDAGGGTVTPQPAKGKFLVDWAREAARVHAAKLIAQLITGKDDDK